MNKIYQAVADCRKTFVEMSYTFTQDINEIEETVQELMLYFMQMNPDTLKSIYEKDGTKGWPPAQRPERHGEVRIEVA